jgi:hypothetical protein
VLSIVACGGGPKLTAEQTEAVFHEQTYGAPRRFDVDCRPAQEAPGWDYLCAYPYLVEDRTVRTDMYVQVDADSISKQTFG